MFSSLVFLSLAALTIAQSTGNTALELAAIQAHFSQAGLVPDLLQTFAPTAVMNVTFDGVGAIQPGQAISGDQARPTPSIAITPGSSSVQLDGTFTLLMVDAGPVGSDQSQGQTRHYLVNGVTVQGSTAPESVNASSGTAITDYAGPAPPPGSGPHRYVILLYTQPSTFAAPADLSQPVGVSTMNLTDYVQSSGLGNVVAGMYFTVEDGAATFTPSATSAVVTSTLSVSSGTSATSGASTSASPTASNSAALPLAAVNNFVPSACMALFAFVFL